MTESLDGERTVSDVSKGKKSWFTPARKAGVIAIGAAIAVALIVWKDPGRRKEEPEAPPPAAGIGQSVTYDPPKPQAMPAIYQPPPAPPPITPAPPPEQPSLPVPRTVTSTLP